MKATQLDYKLRETLNAHPEWYRRENENREDYVQRMSALMLKMLTGVRHELPYDPSKRGT